LFQIKDLQNIITKLNIEKKSVEDEIKLFNSNREIIVNSYNQMHFKKKTAEKKYYQLKLKWQGAMELIKRLVITLVFNVQVVSNKTLHAEIVGC
jgi:hypothetical protein